VSNFVSQSGTGATFSSVRNTYTPYIVLGDYADSDPSERETITGQSYQEVLTNFPFASQILTGLFLDVTLGGAGTTPQTSTYTIVDRIGYAARQGLNVPENLSVNPSGPPVIIPWMLTA
jgi:hypothetical protein